MAEWNPFQAASWQGGPSVPSQTSAPSYFQQGNYYGGEDYWNNGSPNGMWSGARYQYLNENPDAVFSMFTAPWASGFDPYSTWVRQQYGQNYDAYKAALSMNPDLTYQQFLSDFGEQGFRQRFQAQAPVQQGYAPGQYGAGRVSWNAF
jgi:hypothetical protein